MAYRGNLHACVSSENAAVTKRFDLMGGYTELGKDRFAVFARARRSASTESRHGGQLRHDTWHLAFVRAASPLVLQHAPRQIAG